MSLIIRAFGWLASGNYYIFAVTNIVLVNLGVYFMYDLIKRVCGKKIAFAVLAILFFYIPLYFFPSMIYTDTATLAIPVICLNLFHRLRAETMSRRKEWPLYAVIGAVSGVGFVIKATSAIMFIAIVIVCCVFIRRVKVFKYTALSAAVFISIILLFQIPYRSHVPEELREAHAIPYSHWVMMGLANDGQVNWPDYAVTMSLPSYDEKNGNAVAEIKRRLGELGIGGFAGLAVRKLGVLYSRPDFQPGGIIRFDDTVSPAALKLGAMRDNIFYKIYNGIVFYGAAGLAVLSVLFRTRNYTAYLALLGAHLFFMFWEVNPRYLTNYFFVIIFMACLTVKGIFNWYAK
jgi:hypothetical protein